MIERISDNGLAKLQQWEGCQLKAYKDVAGILTIGFGHTGNDVKLGQTISQAQATRLLIQDLNRFEAAVSNLVKVPLTRNQRDALISFSFNVGVTAFKNSTLLKKLNAKKYSAVPSELMKWVNAGGRKVPGLINRRTQEAALWGKGAHVSSNTRIVDTPKGPAKDVATIGVSGAAGVGAALGEALPDITTAVTSQQEELSSGDWIRIAIAVVILGLTVYAAYRRFKA